jgi:hypothetical protein
VEFLFEGEFRRDRTGVKATASEGGRYKTEFFVEGNNAAPVIRYEDCDHAKKIFVPRPAACSLPCVFYAGGQDTTTSES